MDDKQIAVDQLNTKERLHLSILHGAKRICKFLEETSHPKITFDRDVVALIGEIVWRKLQEMGSDLEHFAKHAKRTTIKPSDVLLLTRRNPSLAEHLSNLVRVHERRRKKLDANAAQVEAVAAIESNTESSDAFSKFENMEENLEGRAITVVQLSDDD